MHKLFHLSHTPHRLVSQFRSNSRTPYENNSKYAKILRHLNHPTESSYLHQEDANGYPDDFADAADDADEDAEGGGKAEGGDGDDETALLHTELHREKAQKVGQERGERENEDGMEEGERDATETASAVYAEEQEHEEDFQCLDDAGQIFQREAAIEGALVLAVECGYLLVDVAQLLGVALLETGGPTSQSWYLS